MTNREVRIRKEFDFDILRFTKPEWTPVSAKVAPTNSWIVIGLLAESGKAADDRVWFDDVRLE